MTAIDDDFLEKVLRGYVEADAVTLAKALKMTREVSREVGLKVARLEGELSAARRKLDAYRDFIEDLKAGELARGERALAKRLGEIDAKFWTAADIRRLWREAEKLAKALGLPMPPKRPS